jgi:signal transduction histidine kinase
MATDSTPLGAPTARLPTRRLAVAPAAPPAGGDPRAELTRLYRMLEDERAARRAAEELAARATQELYDRTGELERSATTGRRLLAGALNAEDHERVALVRLLHDYALQSLLAARQDLIEAVAGDEDALETGLRGLDVGIAQMRETLAGLHPAAMDHAGLGAGIRAIVNDAVERSDIAAHVEIEPGAGDHQDVLLLSVVSEIISNVVLHADARRLSVVLHNEGGAVVLEVADDGRGFDAAATTREALERGRIGLASARERVVAAGGVLVVNSADGAGTTVTVRLPQ